MMIDTNIAVDLLSERDDGEAQWSRRFYTAVHDDVPLVYNHVVLAEIAAGSPHPDEVASDLALFHIELLALTDDAALAAARAFAAYRRRGGAQRAILADFLIAGHAEALGATLVTRDRRLAAYFPDLSVITPETHLHG